MQIGIFAKTFPGTDPDAVLRQVAASGYTCTQFNLASAGLEALPDSVPPGVCSALSDAAGRHGVALSALSGTYNMVHPDPAVRAQGLARLGVVIEAARAMGIPMVTLCTGTRDATDQWRHHPDNAQPDAWADLLAEMAGAIALAERHSVDLGIEPERANVVRDAASARRLIDTLGSARLRIVLDPANLVEPDDAAPWAETIARGIDLLADRIGMAHAKDRATDGRVAVPGHGAVDFPHFLGCLRRAGFDGALVTHGLAAADAASVAAFLTQARDG